MPMSQLGKRTALLARVSSSRAVSLALVAAIVLTDYLLPTQDLPFVPRALVDEPCHLLTAVIVLGAYVRWRGRPPSTWFIWAMLCASVAIDVDHLPLEFGSYVLTAGTPRPYTHALWLVAMFAVAAIIAGVLSQVRGRRTAAILTGICAGAAWGLCAHFLRDVVTADIALWWPVSSTGVLLPYGWYLGALLLLAVLPPPRRAPAQPPRRVPAQPPRRVPAQPPHRTALRQSHHVTPENNH